MSYRKYSQEEFISAIASSTSLAQALKKLNVMPFGGNYAVAKNYIKKLNLDTSHMKGKANNRGKKFGRKRPLKDYLDNKFPIQSYKLKQRLIEEKIFFEVCSICCNKTWLGNKIPLELHHKDSNSNNNNISNLQLLCPNCHTLTENYRGKGKSKNLARD